MVYCDTNIILRYLLKDDDGLYKISEAIIEKEDIFLLNEVTAEIVYVLLKTYTVEKKKICLVLTDLFSKSNIYFNSKEIILEALNLFEKNSIDFVDCILCSYFLVENVLVKSFDKKVEKFILSNKNIKK